MSRKQYTPEQIISMLREAEVLLSQGVNTAEVCRRLGISEQGPDRALAGSLQHAAPTLGSGLPSTSA